MHNSSRGFPGVNSPLRPRAAQCLSRATVLDTFVGYTAIPLHQRAPAGRTTRTTHTPEPIVSFGSTAMGQPFAASLTPVSVGVDFHRWQAASVSGCLVAPATANGGSRQCRLRAGVARPTPRGRMEYRVMHSEPYARHYRHAWIWFPAFVAVAGVFCSATGTAGEVVMPSLVRPAACDCQTDRQPPWHGNVADPCCNRPCCPPPTLFHADPCGQLQARQEAREHCIDLPPAFPRFHGWRKGFMPSPRPLSVPHCHHCGMPLYPGT